MIQIGLETIPIGGDISNLFVAGALGMLLGLEREWSNKSAGIRTFTLTSLLGVAAGTVGNDTLLAIGGALILTQGLLLGARGILSERSSEETSGLALTTSTSLFVAYAVGILIGSGSLLLGIIIAITSSFLLTLRRELHEFANQLSHEEVRGAAEFAIIAFVIYPLLPTGMYGPWDAVDLRLIWTLVIAVSGIGFINYAIMQRYGGRGMLVTGFFGGLVNSTAVIGEIANRATSDTDIMDLGVTTIIIADIAMSVRNLIIIIAFVPQSALTVGLPLGLIAVGGAFLTVYGRNWNGEINIDLDSPFSSKNAITFGVLFLAVLLITAGTQQMFGTAGFLLTSFLSGILSSGTTTTTAVSLSTTGQITPDIAAQGVLAGTLASIIVKIWLAAGINQKLFWPVFVRSMYLSVLGVVGVIIVHVL